MGWDEVADWLCLDRDAWTEEVVAAETALLLPEELYEYMMRRKTYLKTIIQFSNAVKARLGLTVPAAEPAPGRRTPEAKAEAAKG
jgi:hypothetical protein